MSDSLWLNDDVDANGDPLGVVQYHARELRRAHAMYLTQAGSPDRFGARSGVHPSGAPAVDLSGDTITVHNLKAVLYTALTTTIGPYTVQLPEETHTLAAADGANDRKDIVVLRQYDDDEDASGQKTTVSEYIVGTPGSSPSEPSVPSGAFRMATIDVPASGTGSPFLTYNAPYTVASGGVVPVRGDAELPGTDGGMYDGLMRWRQDTNELQVHNGAATWETLASLKMPKGRIGEAFNHTDFSIAAGSADISASVTFTAEANRYYDVDITVGAYTTTDGFANANLVSVWASGSSVAPTDTEGGMGVYMEPGATNATGPVTGFWTISDIPAGTATIGAKISAANDTVVFDYVQMRVRDVGGF